MAAIEAIGQMITPIRADGEMGFTGQQAPLPFNRQAAAEFAGAAAVIDQAIAFNTHRVFTLGLLHRNVAGDISRVAQPVVAIAIRARAPRAGEQLVVDIGRFVGPLPADNHQRVAPFARGQHPIRQQTGQRTPHRIGHAKAGDAAHGRGARHFDIDHGAERGDDGERFEHPRGVGNFLPQDGPDTERHHRRRKGEGAIKRTAHLGRTARKVGGDRVAFDGQCHLDLGGRAANAVAVQVISKAIAAVRPAGDLGAHESFGVGDQVGGAGGEGCHAIAADQVMDGALANVTGCDLGANVADGHLRHAHIGADKGKDRFVRLAAMVEFQPGNAQAILKDFGVVTGRTAWQPPAQVQMVRGADGKGDPFPLPEDRLDNKDVGDVHPTIKGVVHNEKIARFHLAVKFFEERRQRIGHRPQVKGNGDALRNHLAAGVAERGGVVKTVAYNGRVGCAIEAQRHLIGGSR